MYKEKNVLDLTPDSYREYRRRYGRHFTKESCSFAVGRMKREDSDGNLVEIRSLSAEEVNDLLERTGVKVSHGTEYDRVFVANMCLADYLGESVPDMEHLAKYVKNVLDDADGYEGIAFCRWFADMCAKRVEVPWDEFL